MLNAIIKKHWLLLSFISVIILSICFYFLLLPLHVPRPHIIIIIADDMGRNDVGYHGSNQILTPNIDALAYNGIILDRFYTQYACTPSRAALLTGNYPIRYGIHGRPIRAGQNRTLPANVPLMPQFFKKLGYQTHLIGKWHLGATHRSSTPTQRGFDTHFGYWHGFIGYFNYETIFELENGTNIKGLDLHDGLQPVWNAQNKYATELFTEKSLEIIDKHDKNKPLFMIVSHLAAHTGKDGTELAVPNSTILQKFDYIEDERRKIYAGVINLLDESIGVIIDKLSKKGMLENSIIIFCSDNGGQTVGTYANTASNWPLRGTKMSQFEGGVRSPAAIYSPFLKEKNYVNKQIIHITDILPTLYKAAGGNLNDLGTLDGVNQWDTLSLNKSSSRSEILLSINEVDNASAIITNNGKYKYIQGTFKNGLYDQYYGDSGRGLKVPFYNTQSVINNTTNQILNKLTGTISIEKIWELRKNADLEWCRTEDNKINCVNGCLFDLEKDPCESTNIIESETLLKEELLSKIDNFSKILVPQPVRIFDPASNPSFYNGTWCTWLDDELCPKTQ